MTRPEGISQSAWDEAQSVWAQIVNDEGNGDDREHIARAIMAATERAAQIAETHMLGNKHVAAAIRQGSQPSNVIPVRGTVR